MNIKEKFLQLTSHTYPHGTEQELFPLLGVNLDQDEFGNLFLKIGDSDVMFTSHLDTATKEYCEVTHVFEENYIKTDGTSILGADDKAGVTIMLYMIENNIPGLYYFFLGEEVGCVGSRKVAEVQKTNKLEGINKVISFDRRSTDSIITFQSSQRCCSDTFGEALAKAFNEVDDTFKYKTDKHGVLTDSKQFTSIYPECTNISVGYYSEHTKSEKQDIVHLEKLAKACLKINWSELPVERDPSKTEYDTTWDDYYYGGYGSYGRRYDYGNVVNAYSNTHDYTSTRTRRANNYSLRTEKSHFYDEVFEYVSIIETNSTSGKIVGVDLDPKRVEYEKFIIKNLFKQIELNYTKLDWDGFILTVFYEEDTTQGHKTECDRNDLLEYLPDLDYRNVETLGEFEDSLIIQ